MSKNLLDIRGPSVRTWGNDHRMPGLLLDDIAPVLHDREGRNGTMVRPDDASWVITPRNHTTPGHVHGRVGRVVPSRVPWPFAVPGELDHRFTPSVWTHAPLNGDGRKVEDNYEEDRD